MTVVEKLKAKENRLLVCPVRGDLNATLLAKDELTISEEARRIECIKLLLKRGYPKSHIAVETVVIKNLGESGRNKLRCDLMVFEESVDSLLSMSPEEKLEKAILVAEIKRDSKKRLSGVQHQLIPALRQMPQMNALGIYWDDVNRLLFAKRVVARKEKGNSVEIVEDSVENLPEMGGEYAERPIVYDQLSSPENLMSVLTSVANVMRSHGINDEHLRYKETVKLILARYFDEKEARSSNGEMILQVRPGTDAGFNKRVQDLYKKTAKRYANAKTLFKPIAVSEIPEKALRDAVKLIQGLRFSEATSDVMQQIFMSFVPAVFKKSLDQFFTPITLIQCMIEMVGIGPNDKVADPAMGTADFLTAALQYRQERGDDDAHQRIFGYDC